MSKPVPPTEGKAPTELPRVEPRQAISAFIECLECAPALFITDEDGIVQHTLQTGHTKYIEFWRRDA